MHLRVDTDRFPTSIALAVEGGRALLDFGRFAIALEDVPAIWARRIWPGAMPKAMAPKWAAYGRAACRTAFIDVLLGLERPRWVNPLGPAMRAESKLLQLELARRVGLRVPDTLVTNDPSRARAFFHAHGGRVITKLLEPLSQTMDASGDFVYTSVVTAEDLAGLDELRWAPQIFQPLIDKRRELRVIAVGDRFFAGAIDVSGHERLRIDWRRATRDDGIAWVDARLPRDVEVKARALLDRLGLVYGALDFLEADDGEPYFLEVNPAGEWGWLERDLGHPIGDAIAEALAPSAAP